MHLYDIEEFTNHINSQDENIKFTSELEQNEQPAFLDTLLHKQDDGTLTTSVFRKATHSDQYLNFKSNHQTEYKRSVARTLYHPAEKLASEERDKNRELKHIKEALEANGYTKWIMKIPEKSKRKVTDTSHSGKTNRKITVGLAYVSGLWDHLQPIFQQHNKSVFHKPSILSVQYWFTRGTNLILLKHQA